MITTTCEIEKEVMDMGSLNHSYLQIKLGALLLGFEQYMVLSEISLDTSTLDNLSKEIRPDLALFPQQQKPASSSDTRLLLINLS
jgi:hypothetical protein